MVLLSFQGENSVKKAYFFQKIFLLADTNIEIILKITFLTFINANIKFSEKKLILKSYTAAKALHITK